MGSYYYKREIEQITFRFLYLAYALYHALPIVWQFLTIGNRGALYYDSLIIY